MLGDPQRYLQVQGFTRTTQVSAYRCTRGQDSLQWHKAKLTKGKVHWTKSRGNQAQASKSLCSTEPHKAHFIPPAVSDDDLCEISAPCRACLNLSKSKVFIEAQSYRHPVPGTFQNSRLTEGKLVASINHINHKYKLVRHSKLPLLWGNGENIPQFQAPRYQQRAWSVALLG